MFMFILFLEKKGMELGILFKMLTLKKIIEMTKTSQTRADVNAVPSPRAIPKSILKKYDWKSVKLVLEYGFDPKTGDVRIVQY